MFSNGLLGLKAAPYTHGGDALKHLDEKGDEAQASCGKDRTAGLGLKKGGLQAGKNVRTAVNVKGEEAMQRAIMEHGPIYVRFDVYSDFMQRYLKPVGCHALLGTDKCPDIYTPTTTLKSKDDVKGWTDKDRTTCENDKKCAYPKGGHAVIATGWGTSIEGEKYWWLKNSWGAKWGMQGKSSSSVFCLLLVLFTNTVMPCCVLNPHLRLEGVLGYWSQNVFAHTVRPPTLSFRVLQNGAWQQRRWYRGGRGDRRRGEQLQRPGGAADSMP